jgi:hypothetical protein
MMVAKAGDTSRVTWSALLLLAQLLAFGILPTMHLARAHRGAGVVVGLDTHAACVVAGRTADHSRLAAHDGGRGPERTGHDHTTCQFCRIADSRYTPGMGAALSAATLAAARDATVSFVSWRGVRLLHPAHGPRPPPLA